MSPVALLLVFLALAGLIALARKGLFTKGRAGQGMDHWPVFPKKVLSPVEQQLYHRLLRAYPVITSCSRKSRSRSSSA